MTVAYLALPGTGALILVLLRFHDQFPSLREVDGLSDTAFRLHVSAFFWCAVNRTDGLIPREDLGLVSARVRAPGGFASECVRRGAWHDARHDCRSEFCGAPFDADGWAVHDYLKENPSRAELEAQEASLESQLAGMSAGGALGNHRRWHANRGVIAPGCEYCGQPPSRKPAGDRPPPKRTSGSDRVPDRVPESGAIPRSGSRSDHQSYLVDVVSPRARGTDRPPDDDREFTSSVIDAIYAATGQDVTPAHAGQVARDILAASPKPVRNRLTYVLASITADPDPHSRFLPAQPSRMAFAPRPIWCRECDEPTRMREDEDGRLYHCPMCSPTMSRPA